MNRYLASGRSRLRSSVITLAVVGSVLAVSARSLAATPRSTGGSFQGASVHLSDQDSGWAMFPATLLTPNQTVAACISVTRDGDASADVRLYVETFGSDLAPYLNITVTKGTLPASRSNSCAGFTANDVLYRGRLDAFPDSYATELIDPSQSWSSQAQHTYRFELRLRDDDRAESLTVQQSFVWEAEIL